MQVKMADLPGIGKKISLITAENSMVCLITHHTGKRELYFFEDADDDEANFSINLTADETRELGAQLLGAVFQPIDTGKMKLFKSQIVTEWVELKPESKFANKTIGESEIRKKTGVSIVGIFKKEQVVASPDVNEKLYPGDTLMAIGKSEQISLFVDMCHGKGDV